jgi:hypothetical protein
MGRPSGVAAHRALPPIRHRLQLHNLQQPPHRAPGTHDTQRVTGLLICLDRAYCSTTAPGPAWISA